MQRVLEGVLCCVNVLWALQRDNEHAYEEHSKVSLQADVSNLLLDVIASCGDQC